MKTKLFFLCILSIVVLSACKTTKFASDCTTLHLDLKKGTLNNVKPTASQEEVKAAFTCFTGDTEEGSSFNCGGGVFFLKHDFFFYTHRDYLEIRSNFICDDKSDNLINMSKDEIIAKYGQPQLTPEGDIYLYEMPYGTLRVEFSNNNVKLVGIHYKPPAEVELC